MARNVAGSWQKVVKLVQDCSTRQAESAEAQAAVQSVQDLIGQLKQLPTPPKAVWKKVVQQLQVCWVPYPAVLSTYRFLLWWLSLPLGLHMRSYLP